MAIPNTTHRILVEKLGGTDPAAFIGNEGEVFYDPDAASPTLRLSDGSTAGGIAIGGTGGVGTGVTYITAGSGISVDQNTGNVTITATGGGGGGESYWVSTDVGIHTLSNVGVGTTNPTTKLQVGGVLGFGSKNNIKIGDNNTGAVADDPLESAAIDNIFIGVGAGNSSIGGYNVYFGRYAGANGGIGAFNFFGGYRAGFGSKNANNNVFIGSAAGGGGNNQGGNNNFIGGYVGFNNSTGNYNNFFGAYSGTNNTTGSYNNFFGYAAGADNTTGSKNSAFGGRAGTKNQTGNNNTFFGNYTGIHTNTSFRVVMGQGFGSNDTFDVPKNADIQFAVGVRTDANPSKYWLVGNENFNVGIGTTNPTSKLTVRNGDIKVGVNTSNGVILTDANGVAWRLIVNTDGTLATAAV